MTSLVGVVVATRGRADDVRTLLAMLGRSRRIPDHVVIVGTGAADWHGVDELALPFAVDTLVAPHPGLTRQRNLGVRHLLGLSVGRPDIVAFFDDDFVPHPDWIGEAVRVLDDPGIAGVTGTVLCDGAKTSAVPMPDAERLVAQWDGGDRSTADMHSLYGCNMAVRAGVFAHAQFDPRLPLYGWLEDLDFSGQIVSQGRLVRAGSCGGVHRGAKGARVSGRRYGYSQIANPLYLARKGTCSWPRAAIFVTRALSSNLLRSLRRHPVFDYRGRLDGNCRALADLIRGRMRPEAIGTL